MNDVAAELMTAVSAIRRIARRAARQAWWDEPLPPAQSELLRLAAARPGLSVADAAHELRLAPNTVSTLAGRLTAAGLLDRSRAAADGRSVRLTVTEAAAKRIASWARPARGTGRPGPGPAQRRRPAGHRGRPARDDAVRRATRGGVRRRRRCSAGRGRGHRVVSNHRADGGTARRGAAA